MPNDVVDAIRSSVSEVLALDKLDNYAVTAVLMTLLLPLLQKGVGAVDNTGVTLILTALFLMVGLALSPMDGLGGLLVSALLLTGVAALMNPVVGQFHSLLVMDFSLLSSVEALILGLAATAMAQGLYEQYVPDLV